MAPDALCLEYLRCRIRRPANNPFMVIKDTHMNL